MSDALLGRWQKITLATLFTGYASYYICRSNLSVATPLIVAEFADQGVTKSDIGRIASLGVFLYAVGKISNGMLADFFGGRSLYLFGMVASVVCTIVFGMGAGLGVFMAAWAVNRYVQSMGWGSLVKIASRWFPVHRHATVMGLLSMSFLLGDAVARLYLGTFIHWNVGWRGVFFIAAATLGAVAVMSMFLLKASPEDVGAEEPAANAANVFGAAGNSWRPDSIRELLLPLLKSPAFWLICTMNFGLTLVRETFNLWTPTYLTEAAGFDPGRAAQLSLLFPLVGAFSALLAGVASDRCGGRHGRVIVPSLIGLIGALYLLSTLSTAGRPGMALLLICAVAFFLLAPYSFLSGVVALDLGGKRGAATTSGFSDSAGYLGAVFSGYGIGAIAETQGWNSAFFALTIVCSLTLIVALVYWIHQEYTRRQVK